MKFLDLFSGIGGFSLGLERAGHETKAFCEIDAFCRRVLKKHWPHVPRYEDIRELTADRLRADGIEVDAICGGFPCQDISEAQREVRKWFDQPEPVRVVDGVPERMDRMRALGNAVVPQIPEIIGRALSCRK